MFCIDIFYARRLLLSGTLCLLAGCLIACEVDDDDCRQGSGTFETFEVDLNPFTSLRISGSADVILRQSDEPAMSVTIDDNLFSRLRFRYTQNELHISNDDCISTSRPMRIELGIPNLDKLSLSGSGSVTSLGTLEFADLEIDVSGSTEVDMTLKSQSLVSTVNGAADLTLNGSLATHDIVVRGTASVAATQCETHTTNIDISGSANCRVWAVANLNVKISGSGNVAYRGDPSVDSNISGNGSLTQIP